MPTKVHLASMSDQELEMFLKLLQELRELLPPDEPADRQREPISPDGRENRDRLCEVLVPLLRIFLPFAKARNTVSGRRCSASVAMQDALVKVVLREWSLRVDTAEWRVT